MENKIYIASDHAGFELKQEILRLFKVNLIDLGTNGPESVDYPDFSSSLVKHINSKEGSKGILICGSGIGMTIAANRHKNIRAGLAFTNEIAKLMKEHNNANVLVLPGKYMDIHEALKCIENFLSSKFEGGRHLKRIEKIS